MEANGGKRDELVTHRVQATGDMDPLFAELRALLTRLDDEVEGLLDDKAFRTAYSAARVIIDRPGGHSSPPSPPAS
ncbi:MAG: hypothetical protein EOO08_10675 [Chitinophagaceae bacterium]|nr:MAG: hypothetical protein EOO08_10675 [Chitinophagaceae bacterium]